jgi:hypothetical protein
VLNLDTRGLRFGTGWIHSVSGYKFQRGQSRVIDVCHDGETYFQSIISQDVGNHQACHVGVDLDSDILDFGVHKSFVGLTE